MKLIPLTQGKFAKVDDADFEWLSLFNWTARFKSKTWYAVANVWIDGKSRTGVGMHQLVLLNKERVDHIDRDGLNNQRHNLRPATFLQIIKEVICVQLVRAKTALIGVVFEIHK